MAKKMLGSGDDGNAGGKREIVKREKRLSDCGSEAGRAMRGERDEHDSGRYTVSSFLSGREICEKILTALAWLSAIIFLIQAGGAISASAGAGEKPRRVVVVVWDGMRPDFVSETHTPTLNQLARQGVEFADHHPSYLSLTEGNGTVMSTGVYPERTGVLADTEYRPEIDALVPVHTEVLEVVRKGDVVTRGHYVGVPTMVELLRQAGRRTVVAGSKGVVLLADRGEHPVEKPGVELFAGQTLPTNLITSIVNLHGAFPDLEAEEHSRDDWTTGALINPLWAEGVPDFTFLWLNQPDHAQHETGPGSAQSLAAIRKADDNLARVLRALDEKGLRDSTDVMVVSDHGFSTISAMVDLAESLERAGLNARRGFSKPPPAGSVMVVGNGASVLIYVIGHDAQVVKQVVDYLPGMEMQRGDFYEAGDGGDIHARAGA